MCYYTCTVLHVLYSTATTLHLLRRYSATYTTTNATTNVQLHCCKTIWHDLQQILRSAQHPCTPEGARKSGNTVYEHNIDVQPKHVDVYRVLQGEAPDVLFLGPSINERRVNPLLSDRIKHEAWPHNESDTGETEPTRTLARFCRKNRLQNDLCMYLSH